MAKKIKQSIRKLIIPVGLPLLAIIIIVDLSFFAINIRNVNKVLNSMEECTHTIVSSVVTGKIYEYHSSWFYSFYVYYIVCEYEGKEYSTTVDKLDYDAYDIGDIFKICTKHNMGASYEEPCV